MASSSEPAHLRSGEAWFRLIADALPAYVAYIDEDLRYVMVNRQYLEQFKRPEESLVGRHVSEVLGASSAQVEIRLRAALAGTPQRFEAPMNTREGHRIIAVTHLPDRAPNGHIQGIIVHGVDVTERVRADDLLRRSEERFRTLLERASVGICIGDEHGGFSYLNPALLDILGYTEEEVGRGEVRWDQLTPPQYTGLDRTALAELASTGHARPYEKQFRARDGRLVPLLLGATRIPSLASDAAHDVAVFFTDLSAQKAAETALLQSEKLAAVGKLAASISHELNNPLEALTNLLYLVQQDDSLSQRTRDYLLIADRELARMAQVTSHSLRFHRQSTRAQTIAPQALLGQVLSYFQARLDNSAIRVKTELRAAGEITCYEADIRQVLNNLIGNAIDAARYSGRLHIRIRNATHGPTGRQGVRILIADDGAGMPPEVLARVFDAFFTTKGNNGTGLGLWVSHRIVHKHRGTLRVRSSTDPHAHGSLFSLWLPREVAASAQQPWLAEPESPGHR